ncbi:NAD(P)H-binding protein [Lacticaseibacillus camelliae]|uniref:NAD(P)H-binding protein n=1 Tax=Lacticaseibacillus camelliae TaxID=381742 RepID=UPI000AF6DE2B
MTTYAVTGATGRFGQRALQYLAAKISTSDIVALARNTEKAKTLDPAGITIRQADYTDVDQMTQALKNVDRLLFISSVPGGAVSRSQQHQNVVTAAKRAGVNYIAYTSFPHADVSTAALAADHHATEQAILDAGIKHSFLRNNWYLENEMPRLKAAAAGQDFLYAAGEGKVGWPLSASTPKPQPMCWRRLTPSRSMNLPVRPAPTGNWPRPSAASLKSRA